VLPQHAKTQTGVDGERVEPLAAARIPSGFLGGFEAAEPYVRLSPRLIARQAMGVLQALGFHLDMQPHFFMHVALERTRVNEYAPPGFEPTKDPLHVRPRGAWCGGPGPWPPRGAASRRIRAGAAPARPA
jgi:hypothetical protein